MSNKSNIWTLSEMVSVHSFFSPVFGTFFPIFWDASTFWLKTGNLKYYVLSLETNVVYLEILSVSSPEYSVVAC